MFCQCYQGARNEYKPSDVSLNKIIKYIVFVAWLGVNADLSINQNRYVVKFTAVIPKHHKVSFLARFISPIESAQDGWKTICIHLYLDAEHKIHSTENVVPKDVIASQRKHSCSLFVKAD